MRSKFGYCYHSLFKICSTQHQTDHIRSTLVDLAIVIIQSVLGESRGLVVKAEGSQLSGCGFKPRRRILNGVSKASYYKLQWKNELKVAK